MNSTKLWMTAHNPSAFGMPISGHSFGVITRATDACAAAPTAVIVRERAGIAATKGAVEGDLGLAQPYFPGTSAWRPPIC